jgi:hypothetical protein
LLLSGGVGNMWTSFVDSSTNSCNDDTFNLAVRSFNFQSRRQDSSRKHPEHENGKNKKLYWRRNGTISKPFMHGRSGVFEYIQPPWS